MTIRRFKVIREHDYLQYENEDEGIMYRLDGSIVSPRFGWTSFGDMLIKVKKGDRVELPCYTDDLIEGDIAVVNMGDSHGIHTVYIHARIEDQLNILSLTSKSTYWSTIKFTNKAEVLALLGNSFDSERVTYGVEKYG